MSPIILLGVYRSPPPLTFDLEILPCTAPHRDAAGDARCRALPPSPPRFPAQIEAASEAPSDPARAGERRGPHFMAFFGSPLATSARRGLLAAGILLCGALVGSSVTAGAIGARLAARRGHLDRATHTAPPLSPHGPLPHATPKTLPAQLSSLSAAPALPADQPPRAPNLSQRPLPEADDDAKLVSSRLLPLMLGTLGAPTHDPRELVRRAERLIGEGAPISLLRSTITLPDNGMYALEPDVPRRVHILPEKGGGLRVTGVHEGLVLDAAGIAPLDLVTAINGYPLKHPEDALAAYASARKAESAIVELERHGKLVVLEVTWTSPPRQPIRR